MAVLNLDLTGYDPVEPSPGEIPPGDYEVLIVDSRLRHSLGAKRVAPEAKGWSGSKQSAGEPPGGPTPGPIKSAEFEFVVLGPVLRGARLRDDFNFSESGSMCRMKTLAVAARCPNPDFIGNTEELHGLRCRVRVERIYGIGPYGCRNVISGYMPSTVRLPFPGTPPGHLSFDGPKQHRRRVFPWDD